MYIVIHSYSLYLPNAPPISAPLVGMLTFTIPQSDPKGLVKKQQEKHYFTIISSGNPL